MEENITPPAPKTKTFIQRITGIFFEPKSTFEALDEKPDIVTAIVILLIASFIGFSGMMILGFRNPDTIAKMNTIHDEKAMTIAKYAVPIVGGIFAMIFAIAMLLFKAAIIHVLVPFLDGKSTYKKLVTVLGYACAPLIPFSILLLVYALLNPNTYTPLTASLSLFFTPDKVGMVWSSLCGQVDLFAFCSLFLSIQGLCVIYKFTWKKSAAIILTLWLIAVCLQTGSVMVSQHFFPKEQQTQTKDD